jgi:hypothetical protein
VPASTVHRSTEAAFSRRSCSSPLFVQTVLNVLRHPPSCHADEVGMRLSPHAAECLLSTVSCERNIQLALL